MSSFDWQPIETAPQDGTKILTFGRGHGNHIFSHDADEHSSPMYSVAHWAWHDSERDVEVTAPTSRQQVPAGDPQRHWQHALQRRRAAPAWRVGRDGYSIAAGSRGLRRQMGRQEQRLYTVGRFWLAQREQSPFFQIRWYDERAKVTRGKSSGCRTLDDAIPSSSLTMQPTWQAVGRSHLLLWWRPLSAILGRARANAHQCRRHG
jgi:hypothetical protein